MIKILTFFRTKKTLPAFSLVELLIYMALFMGFVTILSGLFLSTLEAHSDSTANAHLDQDGWYVMSRLRYDFGQATSVSLPANNGDTGSTLILNQDGTLVTYSLVGNKLTISKNGQTEPIVSQEVSASNLSFQRLGADGAVSIVVQVELTDVFRDQPKTLNFTLGTR